MKGKSRPTGLVSVVAEPAGLLSNPDIDLIVIATPNDTHFPLAKAALEAGKHVVVDKPFTVTLSQARSWRPWPALRQTAVRFS
jgi:predicted dehydrogenase